MDVVTKFFSKIFLGSSVEKSAQSCTDLQPTDDDHKQRSDHKVWQSDFISQDMKLIQIDDGHSQQASLPRRSHQVRDCSHSEGPSYLCGKPIPEIRPKQAWGSVNRKSKPGSGENPTTSLTLPYASPVRAQPAPQDLLYGGVAGHQPTEGSQMEISYLNYDLGHHHYFPGSGHLQACYVINETQDGVLHVPNELGGDSAEGNMYTDPIPVTNSAHQMRSAQVHRGGCLVHGPVENEQLSSIQEDFKLPGSLHEPHKQQGCIANERQCHGLFQPGMSSMAVQAVPINLGPVGQEMKQEQGQAFPARNMRASLHDRRAVLTPCSPRIANHSTTRERYGCGKNFQGNQSPLPMCMDPPIQQSQGQTEEGSHKAHKLSKSRSTQIGSQMSPLVGPNYSCSGPSTKPNRINNITSAHHQQPANQTPIPGDGLCCNPPNVEVRPPWGATQACSNPKRQPQLFVPTTGGPQCIAESPEAHRKHKKRHVVDQVAYFEPVQPNSEEVEEGENTGGSEGIPTAPVKSSDPPSLRYCGSGWCPLASIYDNTWDCEGSAYGELDISKITCGPCIGRGASSMVHQGMYNVDGVQKMVALKFLMKGASGHDVRKEFRRESQILVKVPPHMHVVKMIGVVSACMVLEYCNRGSLYAMLHDPKSYITWGKVWELALAVAAGMGHLHNHRIIHRDLKPGNIMVNEDSGSCKFKIADFGLSRNFLMNSPMTAGVGTWQYSAPEVLCEEKYSPKADVYSYGMVVWEACTRSEPYQGQPAAKAFGDISAGVLPAVPKSIPSGIQHLLQKCLTRDPDERPTFKKICQILTKLKPSIERVKHEQIMLPLAQ